MSQISEMLDFVKSRMPHGANLNEISSYLEIDKGIAKNIIRTALEDNIIIQVGEKRGIKYLVNAEMKENASGVKETVITGDAIINEYLKKTMPLYDMFITLSPEKIIPFAAPKTLKEFIQNGIKIKSYTLGFDKVQGKNTILKEEEKIMMNYFSIKLEGKTPILKKVNVITDKVEILEFPDYQELREELKRI